MRWIVENWGFIWFLISIGLVIAAKLSPSLRKKERELLKAIGGEAVVAELIELAERTVTGDKNAFVVTRIQRMAKDIGLRISLGQARLILEWVFNQLNELKPDVGATGRQIGDGK